MLSAEEHQAARDALLGLFFAADRRDWVAVRQALADQVRVDYTSLNGGGPATVSAGDLVTAWRGLLPGFDATQHQLSVVASQESAGGISLTANGLATHRLDSGTGDSLWTVGGYYAALAVRNGDRWVIAELTFACTWGSGNRSLAGAAQERAAAAAGEPAGTQPSEAN